MTDRDKNMIDRQRRRARRSIEATREALGRLAPPPNAEERRRAITRAINDLRPKPDADINFAVMLIEQLLDQRRHAIEVPSARPAEGAEQLRGLAEALRTARTITQRLNPLAREEINQVKTRHNLKWQYSFILPGEFSGLLDEYYPSIIEVAEEAASQLDRAKVGGRPKGRNRYLSALAALLAALFETLTGAPPSLSKHQGKFSDFVAAIFVAGEIYEPEKNTPKSKSVSTASSLHYAAVGAKLHEESKGAKPPEISWVIRLE